jgi:hypothetical protein
MSATSQIYWRAVWAIDSRRPERIFYLKVRKNSVATPHALEFHIVSHSFTT